MNKENDLDTRTKSKVFTIEDDLATTRRNLNWWFKEAQSLRTELKEQKTLVRRWHNNSLWATGLCIAYAVLFFLVV